MKRVLVIEDEARIRANLVRILTFEGYAVVATENGIAGLAAARERTPDLVICDLLMPEMSGYGVLAELRAAAATRSVPFILLTASAEEAERARASASGADAFITKPFALTDLLAEVQRCLTKRTS